MRLEDPAHCLTYGEGLTVKHIILHCLNYADARTSLNIPDHLYEALGPSLENYGNIMTFLQRNNFATNCIVSFSYTCIILSNLPYCNILNHI